MKNAYAGQPDFEQQIQQVPYDYMNEHNGDMYETAALELPADDVAEDFVIGLGDTFGYWPLLGLMAFGALIFFRKQISKWTGIEIRRKPKDG